MSKYRRAARTDNNQKTIVKTLRQLGYSVITGHDDILVGCFGKTFWFEIKEPETISTVNGKVKPSSIQKSQKKLLQEYKGHYRVVTSINEILKDISHGE